MGNPMREGMSTRKRSKSGRGSTDNKGRLAAFTEHSGRGDADWGNCSSNELHAVVQAITRLGGAITIGLSRDQGAYSMTLLLDKKRETLWFNGDADLDDEMAKVLGILDSLT